MQACRRESKSSPPLIHEKRSPNGVATSSSLWASLPCRQGFRLPYRARISSGFRPLSEPELALRPTAREDHICKAFDLSPQGLVGGLPNAGRAILGAARNGNDDVGLRPSALGEDVAELAEIDLVLVLPPSSVATPCLNANVSWPACVGERR